MDLAWIFVVMSPFVEQDKVKHLESPLTLKKIELPSHVKGRTLPGVGFTSYFLSLLNTSLPVSGPGQFGGKSNELRG